MSTVLEIEREAMQLTVAERERLANQLLQSLVEAPLNEVDQAWVEEAERRFQDFTSGRTQGVSGDQIFSQIREELGWPG
jgi:putative addiction module component (TIGR02574 family)